MKPVTIAIIPTVAAALIASSALAQSAPQHSVPARGPAPYGAPVIQSRVQQWYSDTGWQPGANPGPGPVQSYGYGYGYGGAGHAPHAVIAPAPEPLQQAQSRSFQPSVTRSMPFGYVVDGFGRYPWQRGAVYQSAAQPQPPMYGQQGSHHLGHDKGSCPHHAPAPHAPAHPPLPQPADSGYFAVPSPAPVSATEIPYRQEIGERG